MKHQVSELTGRPLDYAVALAIGGNDFCFDGITWGFSLEGQLKVLASNWSASMCFCPSTHWAHGGPLKQLHKINTGYNDAGLPIAWLGHVSDYDVVPMFYGPTELIAAMRCLVTSRLGDCVELPEGLT